MILFSRQSHPHYDKHDELLKAIWSIDRTKSPDEKLAQLKSVVAKNPPTKLVDILDDNGQARAQVPPLIIACFEGDYDTIKFLLDVNLFISKQEKIFFLFLL